MPLLWSLLPSMVGAVLVGVHLRSWTWAKIPLVVGAVVAAFGAFYLFIGTTPSTSPTSSAIVPDSLWVAIGVDTIKAGVFGVAHALSAAAGVWWGQRRDATTVGSTKSSLHRDAST